MNAAARLVTDTGRYEHITPVLRDVLHWLPVQQRIIFKIAVLAFHCVRGTHSAYFKDVCVPLAALPGRTNLRAADRGDWRPPGAIYKNEDWWPKFPPRFSTHCLEFTTTSSP